MPPFRFRLKRIFEWQRTQRDLEEQKLRQIYADIERVNSQRVRLQADRVAVELEVSRWGSVNGRDLAALDAYKLRLHIQDQRLAGQQSQLRQQSLEQRDRWMEAQRRYRLLERLEARRLREFEHEWNLELEKLAAEAYLGQWPSRT